MSTGEREQVSGTIGQVPVRAWYARDVLSVANDLLGSFITTIAPDGVVTIRLTEVEAYGGADDPASHAAKGRNARNAAMFAEPGRLYVYRHLGLHDCVNVVTGPAGEPAAVLLRAGEVVEGAELAMARRLAAGTVDSARQLARGPGRLAVALGLGLEANTTDVTEAGGSVVLHRREGYLVTSIAAGPRVGVGGVGADPSRYPWRLWLAGDATVSSYRPSYRGHGLGAAPSPTATA